MTKNRTYRPTTYKDAKVFYTPGKYADILADSGVPPELGHECTLPVVCNRSNKSNKHKYCLPVSHANLSLTNSSEIGKIQARLKISSDVEPHFVENYQGWE